MLHKYLTSVATLAAAAVLSVGLMTGATAANATVSTSASVSIQVRVRPVVYCSVVSDNTLRVRANAPWSAYLRTADGVQRISGGITNGQLVTLPAGTTDYSVSLD